MSSDKKSITYTPNTNFNGADSLDYTVSDGKGGTDTAKVRVTVTAVNDPPVFPSGTITRSVNENTSSGVNVGAAVTATDPDGDTLTYSLGGTDGNHFTIGSSSGQIQTKSGVTYDYESKTSYSVTVTVSDGKGGSASKAVTINIGNVNERPVAKGSISAQTLSVGGSAVTVNVSNKFSDPDNDKLTYTASSSSSTKVTTSVSGSDVTVTPVAVGSATVAVAATDPGSLADTLSFSVTVNTFGIDPISNVCVTAGQSISDIDVSELVQGGRSPYSYSIENAPSGVSMDVDGVISGGPDKAGVFTVNVVVQDKNTDTATRSFTITANRSPEFPSGMLTRSLKENTSSGMNVGTAVTATDPDGDTLTYSLGGTDGNRFTIGSSSGQIQTKSGVTYDYESKTSYSVTVTVSDGKCGSASKAVTITLNDVSEKPNKPATPSVSAASSTSLNVSWTAPANTGPAITDYDVQYRKGSDDFAGVNYDSTSLATTLTNLEPNTSYDVQVRATNDEGTSDWSNSGSGTTNQNQPPEFQAGLSTTLSIAENTSGGQNIGDPMTATDAESSTLKYSLEGTDANSFTIGLTNGQIQTKTGVTYNYEAKSSYSVTVKVKDGHDGSASKAVTITLNDVSEKPDKPATPSVSVASSTSLKVTWTAPANTGPAITDYDVQYRKGSSGAFTAWAHSGTGLTTTITSLTANTSYEVQVRATNGEGTGNWSNSGSGTTSRLPTLSINSPSVTEGNSGSTTLRFTVTLSATSGQQVTVAYADTMTGTATSGTDYTAITSGTLTFTAGQTSKNIDVSVIGDTVDEPNETVKVTLSSPTNATFAGGITTLTGTGTITDNDAAPSLSINSPSVTEGDSGSGSATLRFTVTLSAASGKQVTVAYADTLTGTATSGTDYTAITSGTLTFTAGQTSKNIDVSVIGDTVDEPNETVDMQLSSESNATIATGTGTGTIRDDDSQPTVTLSLSRSPISENGGTTTVTATLNRASSAATAITVSATPGTDAAASDFTLSSNKVLTIAAGATTSTGTVTITAVNNNKDEPDKLVTVSATAQNSQGVTAPSDVTLTIRDDDAQPTVKLVLSPEAIDENGGLTTVTATLNRASSQATTITVSTMAVSPAVVGDFTVSTNKKLTIAAGATTSTGTVTITAVNNNKDEPDKYVTVSATEQNSQGVTAPSAVTLTIRDDDTTDLMPVFNPNTYTAQSYVQNTQITSVKLPKATGGDGTLTYSLGTPPALPTGLTYTAPTSSDDHGGTIAGTPTATKATTTYTLTATDTDGDKATLTFTIKVAADLMPVFNPNTYTAQTYRQNTQITSVELPKATGGDGTLTYSLGTPPALPTGLTYTAPTSSDDHGGTIVGTPTATKATTTYTLTATDTDGDKATLTFTITVSTDLMPVFNPNTYTAQTYTQNSDIGTVTLPKATGGDGTLAYALSPTLPAGLTFNQTSRILSGIPTAAKATTTYTLTATDSDGDKATLTFTITVSSEPQVTFTFGGGATDTLEVTKGFSISDITVEVTNVDSFAIDVVPEVPGITISSVSVEEGTAEASITGTPTQIGTFTFAVKPETGSATVWDSFVMKVLAPLEISVRYPQRSLGTRQRIEPTNVPITPIQMSVSGGESPYRYSISGAPSGISISSSGRLIEGTPTTAGTFNITVTVRDTDSRIASRSFSMIVYSKALAEKFSPILILTEHPSRKGREVIFPEPVEIMGAESVDNLKLKITISTFQDSTLIILGRLDEFYKDLKSWHSYLEDFVFKVSFSENKFAFLPESLSYISYRSPPGYEGVDGVHVQVQAYFDYPGENEEQDENAQDDQDVPKSWYNYYFSNTHPKRGNNPMFPNTAYVHVFERYSDGKFVIQYYYFYPFNDFQNNHEGDWPHINVVVSSLDIMTAKLIEIDYKFHGNGLTYNIIGERIFDPQIHFAPAEGGTHPVVYVGAGSHGSYPTPGNYLNPGGTRWYTLGIGVDEALTKDGIVLSTSINDVSFPDTIAQSYDLKLLPNPDRNQPNMGLPAEMSWLGTGARWGTLEVPSTLGLSNESPQGPFYSGWDTSGTRGYLKRRVPYGEFISSAPGSESLRRHDKNSKRWFQQFPIVQNVTWRGNIELIGDIVIYPGATLTIEAGATIRAYPYQDIHEMGNDSLRVEITNYGTIVANGSSDTIVFQSNSSNPMPNDWYGITNHGTLTMSNVVIRDAADSVRTKGSGTQTLANVQYFNIGTGSSMSSSAPRLSSAMRGNREAVLEWWPVDNPAIARYQYRQRIGISGTWSSWTDLARTGAAPYHYHVTGLTNGTEYIFQVRGVDSAGNREVEVSGSRVATPAAVPAKVSNLAVSTGNAQVTLNWTNPQDTTIAKYQYDIRRDNIWAGMMDIPGSDSTTTSYIVTGLGDSLYGFAVRAVNSVGAGPRTQPVSARPLFPPSPPARVGTTVGNGKVRIGWPAASDNGTPIQKYQYRLRTTASTWAESEWKDTDDRALRIYRYVITGLTNNTRYYFQVRAVSSVGASAPSDSTWGTPKAVPEQVMNVVAVAGNGQVTLTWNAANDTTITKYQYRHRRNNIWSSATDIPGSSAATTSYTVTGLTNNTRYGFTLYAVNDIGVSWIPSKIIYATPTAAAGKPALELDIPDTFSVAQNYPNPFNPETIITYELPQSEHVKLVIYNVLGQEIRTLVNDLKPPGRYVVVWDSRDELGHPVSSGIYLYRMVAGDFVQIKKMLILK